MPRIEVEVAIDHVSAHQSAEKQNLSPQEGPHAQGVGFVLLRQIVELLGDER